MSSTDSVFWNVVVRWRARAFLVAGGSFVVFAAFWTAFAVTDVTPRPAVDVFGPLGWALAFAGLVGLVPELVDRSRWSTRAGGVVVVVGAVGALVTAAANAAKLAGVVGEPPVWFAVFNLPIIAGIILGFALFAIAAFRAGTGSRVLPVLLLTPSAVFAVNFVRVLALGSTTPTWAPGVLGSAQALALLAIGYTLLTGDAVANHATTPTDSVP